jgi:hypothetical protein
VGGLTEFQHGRANLKARNGQLVLQGKKKSQLYWLDNVCTVKAENQANARNAKDVNQNSWASWHHQYGHIFNSLLELLVKNQSVGLTNDPDSNSEGELNLAFKQRYTSNCSHAKPFHHSQEPGDGIHSDLWGPAHT